MTCTVEALKATHWTKDAFFGTFCVHKKSLVSIWGLVFGKFAAGRVENIWHFFRAVFVQALTRQIWQLQMR